jgi:hypothetical protein
VIQRRLARLASWDYWAANHQPCGCGGVVTHGCQQ